MNRGYNIKEIKDKFADFGIKGNMVEMTDAIIESLATIIVKNNEKLAKEVLKEVKRMKSE